MEGSDFRASRWLELRYVSAVFVGLLIFIFLLKNSLKGPRLPPGPRWLPIIGNAHQVDMKVLHQSFFNLSKKYGDITFLRLGPIPLIIISSPAMAEEILKVQDHIFASRPKNIAAEILGVLALAPMGETWRRMRRLVNVELMTKKRIQQSEDRRTGEILKCVKQILDDGEKGTVNLGSKMYELSFNLATQSLFRKSFSGYKTSVTDASSGGGQELHDLIRESMKKGMFVPGDIYPFLRKLDLGGFEAALLRLRKEFDDFFNIIYEEHRREAGGERCTEDADFVDILLSLQEKNDENSLTDKEMNRLLYDLMLGSQETISNQVIWIITDVIRHPKVLNKLQMELDYVVGRERLVHESDLVHMKYVDAVVKECFRLHPAFPIGAPHESIQATKVAGYDIPAKTRAFVNLWAMGRDPRWWENPLEFNPDRFLESPIDVNGKHYQLLPFGSGRRICAGLNMGLSVTRRIVAQLFHSCEFTLPSGVEPEDVDVEEEFAGSMSKVVPLELCVSPRLPSHAYNQSASNSYSGVAV